MQYATYNYFIDKYLHNQDYFDDNTNEINVFEHCLDKATAIIDRYTFGNVKKLDEIPECVKQCCCEIAQRIYEFNVNNPENGVAIVSEKVGDLSTSYESSESRKVNLSKANVETIKNWLSGTGLLYRGVN